MIELNMEKNKIFFVLCKNLTLIYLNRKYNLPPS